MSMTLGECLRTTLFGESHGDAVGALLEGVPPGTPIIEQTIESDIARRRPGRSGLSSRSESDSIQLMSGVHDGVATGGPILMICTNSDARSSDYGFLPDHPRPAHADLPEMVRSGGSADLRGGGMHSGRLTLGLVAAGAVARPLASSAGFDVVAHCASVGDERARSLIHLLEDGMPEPNEDGDRLNCFDAEAAARFSKIIDGIRRDRDSIGSTVEIAIRGLGIGIGEPWFDGIEPSLSRGLMAIPGARAVEFGRGIAESRMRGSDRDDAWMVTPDGTTVLSGSSPAGALAGLATGSPISIVLHMKAPSSIAREQETLHIPSGELRPLVVKGRHDPTLAPRAAPVAEAVCRLILCDLWLRRTEPFEES